jgi:acetyl esterase/lipase
VRLSFWLGFLVNELPFVAFYVLAASTALAIAQGDIANPVGWIGLGLAVLADRRARRRRAAGDADGRAVDEALNAAGLPPGRADCPLRIFFWPFRSAAPGVERISNIAYGDAGRANLLDVYRSQSHSGIGPTFVHLHGGGVPRRQEEPRGAAALPPARARGWVCISANYRLRTQYSDPLDGRQEGPRLGARERAEHGADPERRLPCGQLGRRTSRRDDCFDANDPSVTAVVSLYGYYGPVGPERPRRWRIDGRGAPPFFVAHPDRDTLVVVGDARRFVETLAGLGLTRSSTQSCRARSTGSTSSTRSGFEAVIDGIEAFADGVLRPTSPLRRPPTAPGPVTESSGSPGRGRAARR